MTINDQIKDEKLQHDINRKAGKILALSSGKYECLTGKKILPSNQQQIIEQSKVTYCPLRKVFEKQIKPIQDQGEKQDEASKGLRLAKQTKSMEEFFPEAYESAEIKNKLNEFKEYLKKSTETI